MWFNFLLMVIGVILLYPVVFCFGLLEKVFLENKNKFKNQITVYPNLINNNLVYSYLSKNNFDNICCLLYSVTKGYIGYCKHKSNKKSYNELSNPIIKK